MANDFSNETLPPPFPPQSQKEIIEKNTNYLSKALNEFYMYNYGLNMVFVIKWGPSACTIGKPWLHRYFSGIHRVLLRQTVVQPARAEATSGLLRDTQWPK